MPFKSPNCKTNLRFKLTFHIFYAQLLQCTAPLQFSAVFVFIIYFLFFIESAFLLVANML